MDFLGWIGVSSESWCILVAGCQYYERLTQSQEVGIEESKLQDVAEFQCPILHCSQSTINQPSFRSFQDIRSLSLPCVEPGVDKNGERDGDNAETRVHYLDGICQDVSEVH